MRHFTTTVTIATPLSDVWTVLADVERWPDWNPSARRVERLESSPLGVGSRVRIEQPKLRPAIWTVTAWEPVVAFTWVSRSPGLITTGAHGIEPSADGARVTLSIRFDGVLAPVVGALMGGLTRRYIELEAAGLKARCAKP